MNIYWNFAKKDIRVLNSTKKQLSYYLLALFVPSIFVLILYFESNPVLAIAHFPALTAILVILVGSELVSLITAYDMEQSIYDILFLSKVGRIRIVLYPVLTSVMFSLFTAVSSLVLAEALQHLILQEMLISMLSSTLLIFLPFSAIVAMLMQQLILLLLGRKGTAAAQTIGLLAIFGFLFVTYFVYVILGIHVYALSMMVVLFVLMKLNYYFLCNFNDKFRKTDRTKSKYNVRTTNRVGVLIKKDMLIQARSLILLLRFIVAIAIIAVLHENPLTLSYEHMRLSIRISTVFLGIFGTLNIALPAIVQDATDKVSEIYAVAGVKRFEYIVSKLLPSIFVPMLGLLCAFTGIYIYSTVVQGVILFDLVAAILCIASAIFSFILSMILCKSITLKREVRSIRHIVMIITILFHVSLALLLPW